MDSKQLGNQIERQEWWDLLRKAPVLQEGDQQLVSHNKDYVYTIGKRGDRTFIRRTTKARALEEIRGRPWQLWDSGEPDEPEASPAEVLQQHSRTIVSREASATEVLQQRSRTIVGREASAIAEELSIPFDEREESVTLIDGESDKTESPDEPESKIGDLMHDVASFHDPLLFVEPSTPASNYNEDEKRSLQETTMKFFEALRNAEREETYVEPGAYFGREYRDILRSVDNYFAGDNCVEPVAYSRGENRDILRATDAYFRC